VFCKQYLPSELMVQTTQEFCTMTQGAMRVEEYERHFMKMMCYAPEDTNLETEEVVLVPARPSPRPSPRTKGK
jgi:hypothetical protein